MRTITRKQFVTKLSKGTFVCATKYGNKQFMGCGLRTLVGIKSWGAELLCGEGSPHEGKVSELRFEKGDKCFENELSGELFIVGEFVEIKYTLID